MKNFQIHYFAEGQNDGMNNGHVLTIEAENANQAMENFLTKWNSLDFEEATIEEYDYNITAYRCDNNFEIHTNDGFNDVSYIF